MTYGELVAALEKRYSNSGQTILFRTQLRNRKRHKNESLSDLYNDISRLMGLAYPGPTNEQIDSIGVEAFIDALDGETLELRLRDKNPLTIDRAYREALTLESYSKSKNFRRGDGDERGPKEKYHPDGRIRATHREDHKTAIPQVNETKIESNAIITEDVQKTIIKSVLDKLSKSKQVSK